MSEVIIDQRLTDPGTYDIDGTEGVFVGVDVERVLDLLDSLESLAPDVIINGKRFRYNDPKRKELLPWY